MLKHDWPVKRRVWLWLNRRVDKNSWLRRICRRLATPTPVTYTELIARTKAGGLVSQGLVYHMLGIIDCGNPQVFVAMLKRWGQSEADQERMKQLVSAFMTDYVFAIKFDEIVFNPQRSSGGGKLTPIERITQEFGQDFPVPEQVPLTDNAE